MAGNDLDKLEVVDRVFGPIFDPVIQRQEYFKTLLPLNTATFLITVTFWEKIVRIPNCKFLILLPLFSFAISLASSLRILRLITIFRMASLGFRMDLRKKLMVSGQMIEDVEKEMESSRKGLRDIDNQISNYQKITDYSYFIGLGLLLLFAVLSVVLKTRGC